MSFNRYMGVPIVETPLAVTRREDWSRVRSPGRAARRRRRGFRQNIRTVEDPAAYMMLGALYAHPAIVADLMRQADDVGAYLHGRRGL